MRKLTVLLCLALCLCLAVPAMAAPHRDQRTMNELDEAAAAAVSLFGGAALLRGAQELQAGGAVRQELAEGALLLGFGRRLLPSADGNPADGTETADLNTLGNLLGQLFSAPAPVPETPSCPCITRTEAGYSFDLTDVDVETACGAYIFSSWTQGERLTVLADLYSAISYFGEDIDLIEQEYITWMRTAQLVLERNGSAVLGYRLVSLTSYPDWLDGAISDWELTLGEDYEVNLPAFFSLASSEDGTDTYTAEGLDAVLTLQVQAAAGDDPLAAARTEYAAAHPGAAITMVPDLSYFPAEPAGADVIFVCPEEADVMRVITLTFPSERQYEFSFYGEIIRNSFYCDGMGLG